MNHNYKPENWYLGEELIAFKAEINAYLTSTGMPRSRFFLLSVGSSSGEHRLNDCEKLTREKARKMLNFMADNPNGNFSKQKPKALVVRERTRRPNIPKHVEETKMIEEGRRAAEQKRSDHIAACEAAELRNYGRVTGARLEDMAA